ncbi:MAG: type II toxin-antitoxin system VapC family toxin [Patescibacteria group bacterium]
MNILLDTNFLFSALGFDGKSKEILEYLILSNNNVFICDEIYKELIKNISQKFSPKVKKDALIIINYWLEYKAIILIKRFMYERNIILAEKYINKYDAPILAASFLPEIDYLITGDKDFLNIKQKVKSKIIILKASEIVNNIN